MLPVACRVYTAAAAATHRCRRIWASRRRLPEAAARPRRRYFPVRRRVPPPGPPLDPPRPATAVRATARAAPSTAACHRQTRRSRALVAGCRVEMAD